MSAETSQMQRAWDRRAEADALYAIEASRRDWSQDEFFEDGRRVVARVMEWVGGEVGRERMLDVGCGLGRTAVAFAPFFERVDGIDLSPRMVEQALARGIPANVRLLTASAEDLAPFGDGDFDFVFSMHVFQHMPDVAAIDRSIASVARVLKPDGTAFLQFDTRRRGPGALVVDLLPDPLLPRQRRRYMRRYRRDPARIREMAERHDLAVEWERGDRTHWHWFKLRG